MTEMERERERDSKLKHINYRSYWFDDGGGGSGGDVIDPKHIFYGVI